MPHQCLGCDKIYDNTSSVILKGCPECGRKAFLYIKTIPTKQEEIELSQESKEMILKELEEVVDIEKTDKPIILKLENIRILAPGKYELDINQLMKKEKPVIYKVQEGTYVIDLASISNNKNKSK